MVGTWTYSTFSGSSNYKQYAQKQTEKCDSRIIECISDRE